VEELMLQELNILLPEALLITNGRVFLKSIKCVPGTNVEKFLDAIMMGETRKVVIIVDNENIDECINSAIRRRKELGAIIIFMYDDIKNAINFMKKVKGSNILYFPINLRRVKVYPQIGITFQIVMEELLDTILSIYEEFFNKKCNSFAICSLHLPSLDVFSDEKGILEIMQRASLTELSALGSINGSIFVLNKDLITENNSLENLKKYAEILFKNKGILSFLFLPIQLKDDGQDYLH